MYTHIAHHLLRSHHYGTEFRIEIVNAETDRAVGSALVSTQILLQKQRDHNVEHHGLGLMSIHKGPPSFKGMLRWKIEIRTGRAKFAMPVTWADAKQGVRATTSSKAFRYDHFPLAPEQDHDGKCYLCSCYYSCCHSYVVHLYCLTSNRVNRWLGRSPICSRGKFPKPLWQQSTSVSFTTARGPEYECFTASFFSYFIFVG